MRTRLLPTINIADVEVRLDVSVFVLIVLVAWAFTTVFRTDNGIGTALAMAAVAAVLVVATTLAHEFAHALEARHRGLHVEAVTLLLFGGVTEMHADGQSARDELAIAVVGPWISLVCGAGFGLIATFADDLFPTAVAGPAGQVAGVLGWWNVVLAVFNIVPGAPLDGGRVLRAVLWMVFGNRLAALRVSVRAGQLIGVLLVAVALLAFVRDGSRAGLLAAALALSGVFLIRAAARELKHAELDEALGARRVLDLFVVPPEPLHAAQAIAGLDRRALADGGDLHAVREDDAPETARATDDAQEERGLLGIVERSALVGADGPGGPPPAAGTVGEFVEPLSPVPAVGLDDDLHTLIDAFQGDHDVVRIVADGRTIGVLSEREVARAIARLQRGRSVT
ncbi:MAG: site-2 protease family protein [Nitriliruptoraceae bacterium]